MSLQALAIHQRSRRALIGAALAGIGAITAGRFTAGAALLSTPEAETATLAALEQTPLGEQLAWFLAAVNDGGVALTEADVAAHVAPEFLAVVPPAQIIGFMQGLAGGYGTLTLQGVTRPPTVTQAVALVSTAVGLQLALPLTIEAADPHRITGLTIYPSPSGDGTPLVPDTGDGVALELNWPLVDIGERGIYRADEGAGGPTVVFEAGLGDSDATWSGVIPAVASFARVISYDRPNTTAGASDPAPMPRTADDVVADLHALLARRPNRVRMCSLGIRWAACSPGSTRASIRIRWPGWSWSTRRTSCKTSDGRASSRPSCSQPSSRPSKATARASISTPALRKCAARSATPLPPMPLVVLSAGQEDPACFPEGWPMEAEAELHAELQTDLAGLVPDGR